MIISQLVFLYFQQQLDHH